MADFQYFDPKQEVSIVQKNLPHWAQAGTLAFITWRTADSLPKAAHDRITAERQLLLAKFGIDALGDWKFEITKLPPADRSRLQWSLFTAWDRQLDRGAGDCLLAQPELSAMVAQSLLHFDGVRYELTDFVVMPNHVHILAAFATDDAMLQQCTSWKRFSAHQINTMTKRTGEFWQVEQFDHLVRSEEHFHRYQRYIADNPRAAGLAEGQYVVYSKELGK